MRNHQVSDGHDSFRNETQVDRRTATQPAEDRSAPQRRQHGPGLFGIYRGHGQLHIPLCLDQHATRPAITIAPNSGSRTPPTSNSTPRC